MITTYSPYGCPGDFFFCDTEKKIKLIIDPLPNYFTHNLVIDRQENDILVLIQIEPKHINDITEYVINYQNSFDKILTYYPDVLENCKNSELFLYAASWVLTREDKSRAIHRNEYYNIFNTVKRFKVSHVMSNKNNLPGHQLRHKTQGIVNKKRNFELLFPKSIEIDKKYQLFESTMFHITIENSKNTNYISEKIIDCFMSYTIPIYWGCPNISDYFDNKGIIFFETEEELNNILDNLTENEYYRRLESVKKNYEIANNFAFYFDRVNEVLNKLSKNKN